MQARTQAPTPAAATTPAPAAARSAPSAAEMYRARRAQRSELGDQSRRLENKRSELVQESKQPNVTGAEKTGLEKRITEIDQRIADVDKQIAASDQEVANAAAVPGATIEIPRPPRPGPQDGEYALGALFMVIVFLPLSIAFARRIWRRSSAVTVKLTNELSDRMSAMEKAVDSVAVEVERIGEGQRFVTQLLANGPKRALSASAVPRQDVTPP